MEFDSVFTIVCRIVATGACQSLLIIWSKKVKKLSEMSSTISMAQSGRVVSFVQTTRSINQLPLPLKNYLNNT